MFLKCWMTCYGQSFRILYRYLYSPPWLKVTCKIKPIFFTASQMLALEHKPVHVGLCCNNFTIIANFICINDYCKPLLVVLTVTSVPLEINLLNAGYRIQIFFSAKLVLPWCNICIYCTNSTSACFYVKICFETHKRACFSACDGHSWSLLNLFHPTFQIAHWSKLLIQMLALSLVTHYQQE